jgi:N-glycosylase/DNA lyase
MFVIEVPYFNLDHIYNSGQAPRWIQLGQSPEKSKYVIPHKNKALKIEQQRDRFDWTKHRFVMSCSEEEFYDIWFEYFDLRMDCLAENGRIKRLGGKFKIPANRGHGIHILKQDPFEAYILGKIIMKVGYEKAFIAMNHIAEVCGIRHEQSMREAGRVTWYEFPTPGMMLKKFDKLRKMGELNVYIEALCKAIVNGGFDFTESDNELFRLFGMHEVNIFPLVGIEDTLIKNFDENPEEFADWYLDEIENKGLVYMYIVHHIINRPKEVMSHGIN